VTTYLQLFSPKHARTHTHIYVHTYPRTYVYTHISTHSHTGTHTCTHRHTPLSARVPPAVRFLISASQCRHMLPPFMPCPRHPKPVTVSLARSLFLPSHPCYPLFTPLPPRPFSWPPLRTWRQSPGMTLLRPVRHLHPRAPDAQKHGAPRAAQLSGHPRISRPRPPQRRARTRSLTVPRAASRPPRAQQSRTLRRPRRLLPPTERLGLGARRRRSAGRRGAATATGGAESGCGKCLTTRSICRAPHQH